ncbi:hypothetical protein M3Y98_00400400 [Aphelenchoides besseyi]|nr:hypothetical protein M3Y98_00400400 [Aphelenchoides besseyi]KAI6202265.1 hypothetical protein M3Y96_00929900 [Aphelenchoides besseyi]
MAKVVEEFVTDEKIQADLLHQLADPRNSMKIIGSGNMDTDYRDLERVGVQEFIHLRHSPLPRELRDQLDRMQSNCGFGLFPVLSRAWLTVDTDLFLWNFETNKDLAFYDQITHTIVRIDLACVKAGIFESKVKFLLVVATTVDVIILAASFVHENDGVIVGPIHDYKDPNIYLVLQEIHRLPLDGGIVEQLCCTGEGRIFYSIEDTLYEITYYKNFWSGRVFKKVVLTKGLFSSMMQVFSTKDPIKQVLCDDTRHVLYVLTSGSKIMIYDLGSRGDSFHQVVSYSVANLQSDIANVFGIDSQLLREISSIAVIPSTQSLSVHLVATLQSGYRVYFTYWDKLLRETKDSRHSQEATRPKSLSPIHFRYPPPFQSQYRQGIEYKNYFMKIMDDITILAFESATNTNASCELIALSTSNFPNTQRLVESKFKLPIQQPVWTVEMTADEMKKIEAEIAIRARDNAEIELVPQVQPRAFCRQHDQPTIRFYTMSADGVDIFSHQRPVELYRRILEHYGTDSKQMHGFVEMHGPVEICIMALIVLSTDTSPEGRLKEMALRMFFAHGGQPTLILNLDDTKGMPSSISASAQNGLMNNQYDGPKVSTPRHGLAPQIDLNLSPNSHQNGLFHSTPTRQSPTNSSPFASHGSTLPYAVGTKVSGSLNSFTLPPPDLSRISFTNYGESGTDGYRFQPSNRSRALFAHFSRVICVVWHKFVCRLRDDRFVSGLSLDEVRSVLGHLVRLIRVVEGFSLFPTVKYTNDQDRQKTDATKQEERSVRAVIDLMQLSKEYLSLWLILLEHDFHAVVTRINEELRQNLSQWHFSILIQQPESVGVELISGLVRYYLGDEANTAMINERLGQECPRLFTNDDANVLKATELIYHASSAKDIKERHALVQQALGTLKRHAKRVDFGEIAKMLKEINYYKGIAELALSCALAIDPRNLALNAFHRKMPENEDSETRMAIQKRNEIYKVLISIFEYLHGITEMDENVVPGAKLSGTAAGLERDIMARVIMEGTDELCKMRVFQFLVDHELEVILVGTRNPSFENFICREIKSGGDARCHDLLWRYYKGTEEYAKAARLLYELATKNSQQTDIHKKMSYLSQALLCINSAPETKTNTELKMKIRDWLDVAQVQRATLAEIENNCTRFDRTILEDARAQLSVSLLTVNELLKIATDFNLPLIKLAVFHCSGYYDQNAIQEIYKQIINEEVLKMDDRNADQYSIMRCLAAKILHLKKMYEMSSKFFPYEFIIHELLHIALHNANPEWLLAVCKHAELSMISLIDVASRDFRTGDPFWKKNSRARKFMQNLFVDHIYADFRENAKRMLGAEKKLLKSKCLDFNADLMMNATENDEPVDSWEAITKEIQAIR